MSKDTDPKRRHSILALSLVGLVAAMVGLSFASVPLYRAFCQATGFDGAVRRAQAAPGEVLDKTVTVRFDTNTRDLPWDFTAEQTTQQVKIGETKLAFFKVTNHADHPVTARAIFNVVPEQAGAHFRKLQCFCFSDQTIGAGQTVEMPVLYFIDPKWADDLETRNQSQVTLSYTFYPAVDAKPAAATAQAAQAKPVSALGG